MKDNQIIQNPETDKHQDNPLEVPRLVKLIEWEEWNQDEAIKNDIDLFDGILVFGRLERSDFQGYMSRHERLEAFFDQPAKQWFSCRSSVRSGKLELLRIADVTHILKIPIPA